MLAEEKQFLVSQYVDGTLTADERHAVDAMLKSDVDAQKLLVDFRELNNHLLAGDRGPTIRWDSFSRHISGALSDDAERATTPVIAGRIGNWSSARLRIAAAILVAATAWIAVEHGHSTKPAVIPTPAPSCDVTGPEADAANGPHVTEVSVGPSAVAAGKEALRYGQGATVHPSKVVIVGMDPTVRHDSHLH